MCLQKITESMFWSTGNWTKATECREPMNNGHWRPLNYESKDILFLIFLKQLWSSANLDGKSHICVAECPKTQIHKRNITIKALLVRGN